MIYTIALLLAFSVYFIFRKQLGPIRHIDSRPLKVVCLEFLTREPITGIDVHSFVGFEDNPQNVNYLGKTDSKGKLNQRVLKTDRIRFTINDTIASYKHASELIHLDELWVEVLFLDKEVKHINL